jgi:tight adherence protein B
VLSVAVGLAGGLTSALLVRAARRAALVARIGRIPRTADRQPPKGLGRVLVLAGIDLPAGDALRVWCGGAIAAAVGGSAASPGVALVLVAAVAVGGPLLVHRCIVRRSHAVVRSLPELVERVAGELRSGGTVISAVAALADGHLAVAGDLARMRDRTALGADLVDALARWTIERPVDDVRAVAGALATAHELGGSAAGALDGLATSLRDRCAARGEARAQTTQARLSAWVVGLAPVGYLAVGLVVAPDTVALLVTHPTGRVCLVAGLALLGTAGLVFRRMLREPS